MQNTMYLFLHCHASITQFIYFLADGKGNPHHLCMLMYYNPAGYEWYTQPHGNSKPARPFHPTGPSTTEFIKQESLSKGPKEIVSQVSQRVSGVMGASAHGQLPCEEKQVSYARHFLHFKVIVVIILFIMMQRAKVEEPFSFMT